MLIELLFGCTIVLAVNSQVYLQQPLRPNTPLMPTGAAFTGLFCTNSLPLPAPIHCETPRPCHRPITNCVPFLTNSLSMAAPYPFEIISKCCETPAILPVTPPVCPRCVPLPVQFPCESKPPCCPPKAPSILPPLIPYEYPLITALPELHQLGGLSPTITPCGAITEVSLPDIMPSYLPNPFLPIASPVSALAPLFSPLLPPALPCNCGCNYLKKIPIPPPCI
uniref:Cuticle protein n=1 Tax=Bombyx mori TaxID=7091 RepID=A0A8R2M3C3_BOMMO|nr:proline-rich protein 36-like [Bombyx mori]